MTSPTVLSLPLPPSINRLYRAVGGRAILSKDYRDWKQQAGLLMLTQRPQKLAGQVAVTVECTPSDKRLRDIDNIGFKAVLDLLVVHRVIEGDDSRFVREITARWVTDGDPCRVTIKRVEE